MRYSTYKIAFALLITCLLSLPGSAQNLQWKRPKNPMSQGGIGMSTWFSNLSVDGDFVYVNTGSGFRRSHINGGGWSTLGNGSPKFRSAVRGNQMIIGDMGRLFKSTDGGKSWRFETLEPLNPVIDVVCARKFNAAIMGNNTVAVQEIGTDQWRFLRCGASAPLIDIQAVEDSIFVVSGSEVLRGIYTDSTLRTCWNIPDSSQELNSIASMSGVLICGSTLGAYRSTDGGSTWRDFMPGDTMKAMQVSAGSAFCAIALTSTFDPGGIVYRSDDLGKTWKQITTFPTLIVDAVAYNNDVVGIDVRAHVIDAKPLINDYLDLCAVPVECPINIMAPHPLSGFVTCFSESLKRVRGFDDWLQVTMPPITVTDAAYVGDRLYAVGEGADMAYSDDGGLSWFPHTAKGLPPNVLWKKLRVNKSLLVLHGSDSCVYVSTGMDAGWTRAFSRVPEHVVCFDNVVAAVGTDWYLRLQVSDTGLWLRMDTIGSYANGYSFSEGLRSLAARDSGCVYALTNDGRFFYSEKGLGSSGSWGVERTLPFSDSIAALRCTRNSVFALLRPSGLMRSFDNGATWIQDNYDLVDGVVDLQDSGPLYWASTLSNGLYLATDKLLVSVDSDSDYDYDTRSDSQSGNPGANTSLLVPQPASQFVRSEVFQTCSEVSVLSALGGTVRVLPVLAGGTIDVSSLPSGVYMLSACGNLQPALKCVVWR
jgi:photosystem II stability/assembly factor-like uncharacterized protein